MVEEDGDGGVYRGVYVAEREVGAKARRSMSTAYLMPRELGLELQPRHVVSRTRRMFVESPSQLAAVRSAGNREKPSIGRATAGGPLLVLQSSSRTRRRNKDSRDDSGSSISRTEFLQPSLFAGLTCRLASPRLRSLSFSLSPPIRLRFASDSPVPPLLSASAHLGSPHLASPRFTSLHRAPHCCASLLLSSPLLAETRTNSPRLVSHRGNVSRLFRV